MGVKNRNEVGEGVIGISFQTNAILLFRPWTTV